jgi:hypothetical protein
MPAVTPPRGPLSRALAAVGRAVVKALKVFVVVLLVIIPVPVTALFAKAFLPRRRAVAEKVEEKR